MPSDNYQNFGGINSKYSPYVTTPLEFLNIVNFDFQTPGSLTSRWGSTMYFGQTLSAPISSLYEYANLAGASWIFFGCTGQLWYGATIGQSQGVSFANFSPWGYRLQNYGDFANNGPTILPFLGKQLPYLGLISQQIIGGVGFTLWGSTQADNAISFVTADSCLFGADGNKFFRFNGSTTNYIGCPTPITAPKTGLAIDGVSFFASGPGFVNGLSGALGMGATGCYAWAVSYVNDLGFEGQVWPAMVVNCLAATGTFAIATLEAWVPAEYNIQFFNLYCYWSSTTLSMGFTTTWNLPYTYVGSFTLAGATIFTEPANSTTLYAFNIGTTVGGITNLAGNIGALPNTTTNEYYPLGFTAVTGAFQPAGTVSNFSITNYYPRFLEVYKDRLFLAGFSATPSVVWFSDAGQPEGYPLANNFEVRTDDGQYITAMKAYFTQIYFWKNNSFHVLSGDNPNNYNLQEITASYGALNNRCTAIHEQTLLFLDRKGVVQYNGSQLTMLSLKIQPVFDSMNYAAAVTTACMVHDKLRNQILLGIPVNGATLNNLTVVYDYAINAWTTEAGFTPTVFAAIQGRNNGKNAFYGDNLGRVNWFGPSFFSDNGVGFTTYFKTRFLHDLGETVQKQFRRQYVNMDPISAGTTLNYNFYQDYGSSVVLSTAATQAVFQNRIDFGISARSLAFELANLNPNSPLRIHGFAIAYRMQRLK